MSQAPTNITTAFYDTSCIAISFSDPSNIYINSAQTYYYLASVTETTTNQTTYATATTSPIYIQGLSAGYTYTCAVYTIQTASSDTITITTQSYPTLSDISLTDVSINFINVKWTATDVSYVTVTRRVGAALPYTDICGADYSSPYLDSDISGNTTYYYYVTPYMTKYGSTTAGSVSATVSATTPVAYPTDVSATFYDSSAIRLAFTAPKNSYTTTAPSYYARAVYQGNTITSSETTVSPILLQNLSSATTYSCYILTYLDGALGSTSRALNVTTNTRGTTVTVTGGTSYSSITSSPTYNNMIQFLYSATAYSVSFNKSITAQVLLVAGGGAGNRTTGAWSAGACGGGGGGVGYGTITFAANTTYTITVGSGGTGGSGGTYTSGSNTTITGSSGTTLVSETAYGGSKGASYDSMSTSGGSSGGGMSQGGLIANNGAATKGLSSSYSGVANITYYGNRGNVIINSTSPGAGGGGAGGTGYQSSSSTAAYGGIGLYYSYTGTYYGGGGCGGSPNGSSTYTTALSGGGGNGQGSTLNSANATANTGGGGGGSYYNGGSAGYGGSGIVVLLCD